MEIINEFFAVATPLFILLAVRNTPTIKGIIGELRVNFSLKRKLDKSKYLIVNDIILNSNNDSTQIDHVIVSEYGIFVIETKNMNGWIFGDKDSQFWTQQIFFFKSKFQNPLRQNYKHIKFIENALQIDEKKIYSIVVFTGKSEFRTEMPINVITIENLDKYIKYKDTIFLTKDEIKQIYNKLVNIKNANSIKDKINHIYNLKKKYTNGSYETKPANIHLIYEVVIKSDILKIICLTLLVTFSISYLFQGFFTKKIHEMHSLFAATANKTVTQIKADKNEQDKNEIITKVQLSKQNKYKGDIYSWTTKDGQKAYSNVGFPQDEPYTDGKIEIHQ